MPILPTVIAGLIGTSLMTATMTLVHRRGWAQADMVRALGSVATRSLRGSVGAGVAIHAVSGVMFAFPYTMLLGIFSPLGSGSPALVGMALGALHGIIVSLMLVAVVSERHPVARFRNAGFGVAAAHWFGHLAYGFGVGLMYGVLQISWPAT